MGAYDFNLESDGSYTTVRIAGDFRDIGQLMRLVQQRSRELVEKGVERLLILRESGRRAPPVALVQMLQTLRDYGAERIRCAIVYPDYGTELDFFNANAAMRDIPYRLFPDRESAERYLDS